VVPSPNDLTPAQVARMCGRPLKTVQEWLRLGRLRGYRSGPRFWRVPPEALAELFVENTAADRPAPPVAKVARRKATAARRRREDDELRKLGMLA
jgi:excisionase family DNA binding protein